MNEEDFRKIAKEYAEIYFTKGIDSTKIFKYVDELEKKVEHLENIRKKAIKWVKLMGKYENGSCTRNFKLMSADFNDLLNILNKGE